MSQINIVPVRQPGVGADPASAPAKPQAQAAQGQSASGGTAGDTVTLSPAAQPPVPVPDGGVNLTESDASTTSVNLRQQLGILSLSLSARQNQSILSLLRS